MANPTAPMPAALAGQAPRTEALAALCAAQGYAPSDAALLIPSDLVLDIAGEGLGRQLFLTSDADGNEFCLRPDFTVPLVLRHLQGEAWQQPAACSYCGPIYRQRPGAPAESLQAGIESLGRADTAAADADIVALALKGVRLFTDAPLQVVMGDIGIFAAVVNALGVSPAWKRRLMKDFRRTSLLGEDLDRLANPPATAPTYSGLLNALDGSDPKAARALVTDLLSIAGMTAVGGRSIGEIAERFLEQAAMGSAGLSPDKVAVIRKFLAVDDAPEAALAALRALANTAGIDIAAALAALEARLAALRPHLPAGVTLRFRAGFSRDFDYYTGLVFEVTAPSKPQAGALAGGGRYDRLTEHLARRIGRPNGIPAVGCAFTLEALAQVGGV